MGRRAVSLRIEGRVQGVGYRWWAVTQAQVRGLDGWVRNRREGWVELLAIGETAAVEALVEACARGPAGAQVAAVIRTGAEDDGSTGFVERATV